MITDPRQHIRELAMRRIITARKESATSNAVRQFRVPSLNFNAQDYIKMTLFPGKISTDLNHH